MSDIPEHPLLTRRSLLRRAGAGAGFLGLAGLLGDENLLAGTGAPDPLAPKKSHFPARAKRVIWIFVNGGPSQVDTWDYKPALAENDGKELEGFDKFTGFFANAVGGIMKSPFEFTPRGKCGKMVSSLFPHLGEHVDKMAFIHSGHTESNNHSPALFAMNCGLPRMGLPCTGSWVTYGLGSESRNLPPSSSCRIRSTAASPRGMPPIGAPVFSRESYQGTWFKRPKGDPIREPLSTSRRSDGPMAQRDQLDLLGILEPAPPRDLQPHEADLAARIESL